MCSDLKISGFCSELQCCTQLRGRYGTSAQWRKAGHCYRGPKRHDDLHCQKSRPQLEKALNMRIFTGPALSRRVDQQGLEVPSDLNYSVLPWSSSPLHVLPSSCAPLLHKTEHVLTWKPLLAQQADLPGGYTWWLPCWVVIILTELKAVVLRWVFPLFLPYSWLYFFFCPCFSLT